MPQLKNSSSSIIKGFPFYKHHMTEPVKGSVFFMNDRPDHPIVIRSVNLIYLFILILYITIYHPVNAESVGEAAEISAPEHIL